MPKPNPNGETMTRFKLEHLLIEEPAPHVMLVTLNRPEVANAFNTQMAHDIIELFEGLALDPGDTRCIVVTGAGDRAFCAGGDLKQRQGMSDDTWAKQHAVFERKVRAILDCPVPSIGAVNGAAYAGGCELALALDFLYAGDNARFAQTETRIGIIPGAGGTQTLSRAIGERRTKELIMSAKPFSAAEAHQWGLVNQVLPQTELLETAIEAAKAIAANAPSPCARPNSPSTAACKCPCAMA